MSIREQEFTQFSHSLRGYDRVQVDEHLASLRTYTGQVEDRASSAESALAQRRRELASAPGTVGISERLAAILQLANEEAHEIRERARADSEARIEAATRDTERMVADAEDRRDAIGREIDDLSAVREALVQRLIELGGEIFGATERYRGHPPGTTPLAHAAVELFDAEAVDDDPAPDVEPVVDPVVDPDADTQALTVRGDTPAP